MHICVCVYNESQKVYQMYHAKSVVITNYAKYMGTNLCSTSQKLPDALEHGRFGLSTFQFVDI